VGRMCSTRRRDENFYSPILLAICTSTFSKLCKIRVVIDGLCNSVQITGTRGTVVGVQAGRSRVRFPMRLLDFFQLT
jgi:hypothetical protein